MEKKQAEQLTLTTVAPHSLPANLRRIGQFFNDLAENEYRNFTQQFDAYQKEKADLIAAHAQEKAKIKSALIDGEAREQVLKQALEKERANLRSSNAAIVEIAGVHDKLGKAEKDIRSLVDHLEHLATSVDNQHVSFSTLKTRSKYVLGYVGGFKNKYPELFKPTEAEKQGTDPEAKYTFGVHIVECEGLQGAILCPAEYFYKPKKHIPFHGKPDTGPHIEENRIYLTFPKALFGFDIAVDLGLADPDQTTMAEIWQRIKKTMDETPMPDHKAE